MYILVDNDNWLFFNGGSHWIIIENTEYRKQANGGSHGITIEYTDCWKQAKRHI